LGTPFVPFPLIVKLPPAANVPPISRDPLANAPVEKVTVPRSPVTIPLPPPKPVIAIRVDPVRLSPEVEPARVPPMLLKSMLLSAKAAVESVIHAKKHERVKKDLAETMNHSLQATGWTAGSGET